MKIAFNPSTVAALTSPPNNKDITFDLRGRNIFARGVKFKGTDTNTWRDIKINNVSIGSNILDLRNGSNTTLTNSNGVVTINSTWRPVVDSLTSDSTTSSLSANQGRVLKSLIDGKSDSGHNHDDRYLKLIGGTMVGDINFSKDNKIIWARNTDSASISFKNDGDEDPNSYMSFVTSDNGNEYFRWSHNNTEWMSLKGDGLRIRGTKVSLEGHTHDDRYLKLTGGTMLLGEGLRFHSDDNYFGTYADARIISLLDNNDKICDGGLIIDERATLDGKEYVTELLRIRDSEFKWKGSNILHSGNSYINGSTITLNGSSITVYSSGTADGRYVKKSGDIMTGVLTIDTTNFGALTIKRNDDANGASIQFRGKSSVYGYIGLNNSTKDKQFLRWNSDTSKVYTILDTSSTYTSSGKGVINGTTITQVDNATNATNSTNARKLVNWYSARPTSLNAQFGDGSLRIFYATSYTTEGKPAEDSHILHLAWDNTDGWDAQLAVHRRSGKVSTRAQNGGTWQPWKTLAFTADIPSSLKNPYALTISLNGTSQGPYDGSAAKNINITPSSIGAATSDHNHDGRYVYNYGGNTMDGSSRSKNALGMSTTSGISGDWWHILQAAWNDEYRWNSQIAFPTQNRNGMYYRSGLADNTKWGSWVKLLDTNNYSGVLDSRYYTETEVNSLLDGKLNRQNLSYGTWNPRNYHLAADYHYNGGDLSISETGGQIHVSVDGYFWQNEGRYRVLDTSDIAGIRGSISIQQFLSNTDTNWYPIVWGGDDHRNTNNSTGSLYKSHDKLSWQTSSQTLYTTHLQTTDITFPNSGTSMRGIQGTVGDNDFWRIKGGATASNSGYLEIATADDGNEPIYIRQYTGVFHTIKRTLTLLDTNGFAHFPSYINIGGNENNNSSPDRVWGSNSSDSYLRSYRTSALRVAYAVNADTVDGYHATDGRTFNNNINWSPNWNDTWSDGTHTHPWYGFDHRYPNTGTYSTTISDYFGMTIKTFNILRLDCRELFTTGTGTFKGNVNVNNMLTARAVRFTTTDVNAFGTDMNNWDGSIGANVTNMFNGIVHNNISLEYSANGGSSWVTYTINPNYLFNLIMIILIQKISIQVIML